MKSVQTSEMGEESYRDIAERHFLNGLERAREVLILSYSGSHGESILLMDE